MAHAGYWTVAVTAPSWDASDPQILVPVTLDLLVDGEVSGVPEYTNASASATPSASDSATSADPSDSPSSAPLASPDEGEIPPVLPIAVGLAGLGLIGGGAWALVRRRRRSAASS